MHGKGGEGYDWDRYDGEYYFGFRSKFSAARFSTQTTEQRLEREGTIWGNADKLEDIVTDMKRRYGVDRINIVAHSKGGLDSRGYISTVWRNPDNSVETLVTLASPHHGSYMADYAQHSAISTLIGAYTPATASLTEGSVKNFNLIARARSGVKYYTISADAGQDYPFNRRGASLSQIAALPEAIYKKALVPLAWKILYTEGEYRGDNDFLVTVSSARLDGISGHNSSNTANFGPYSLNHHSIRAAELEKGEEDNTIVNLVKSKLTINAGSPGSTSVQSMDSLEKADDITASDISTAGSTLGIFDGTINQGQTVNQNVGIDSSTEVIFSLMWKDGDLNLNLVDSGGTTITPLTSSSTITYTEDRTGGDLNDFLSGKIAQYEVVTPATGQWTAKIMADPILPGGQVDWVLMVVQDSDVTMALATDQPWYQQGSTAKVMATIEESTSPKLGASVQAEVIASDTTSQTLILYDNGTNGDSQANDGIYSNQFTASISGTYRISANASGTTSTGIPFHRTAVSEAQVSSGSAAFNSSYSDSGIDSDGDGLFDFLRITVGATTIQSGQYSLSGVLYDQNGVEMGSTNALLTLNTGNNNFTLDFDGGEIANRGGQGTFSLRELRLIDENTTQPLQVDYQAVAFTTDSYNNSQFQRDALSLTGTNNDFGTDTNANGKYDILTVNVDVYVQQAGSYDWNARLVDASTPGLK